MVDFATAARELRQVGDQVPGEVRAFMASAAKTIAARSANNIRSGASGNPTFVGVVYDGPDMVGDTVEVLFSPRYLARWLEGGTRPHEITRSDKVRQRKTKAWVRSARRAAVSRGKVETMLTTGRDQKGQLLTKRRRAGLQKRRASAIQRELTGYLEAEKLIAGEGYLGPLAFKAGQGDVSPAAKPDSNFAARVTHPGVKPTRPIGRAIAATAPILGPQLAARVNEAWSQVGR